MATIDADVERAVALELREKILALYLDALPIYRAANAWILNELDTALPLPFDVKVQLDAFNALTLPALKLTDWGAEIRAAQPEDTLA